MLAQVVFSFTLSDWTVWVIPGVGVAVAALVGTLVSLAGRWHRRHRAAGSAEDLDWADLLELLRKRGRERSAAGLPPDAELAQDEALEGLLTGLSSGSHRPPEGAEDDLLFLTGGAEQRAAPRRWGNPIEVHLTSPLWPSQLHGVVINRSAGGLAVLVDREVPAGTSAKARSAEAPGHVPAIEVEVRHCRKTGRNYLIGCKFSDEVPWNVRVWFG